MNPVNLTMPPDGPVCPRCRATGDRITKLKGKSTRPGVHKCKDCRKPFTVTVGTVMERSKVPLCKWLLAAQLMASSKKGMSALQLKRMLGTTYETAWFLFHRFFCASAPLILTVAPSAVATRLSRPMKAMSAAEHATLTRENPCRRNTPCSRWLNAKAKHVHFTSPK